MQQKINIHFSLIQSLLTHQATTDDEQFCDRLVQNITQKESIKNIPVQVILYLTLKQKINQVQQGLLTQIYSRIIQQNCLNIDAAQVIQKRFQIKINIYREYQIINLPYKKYINLVIFGKAANVAPKIKQFNSYNTKDISLNDINIKIQQIYRAHFENIVNQIGNSHLFVEDILLNSAHLQKYQMLSVEDKLFNIIYTFSKTIVLTFPFQRERPEIIKLLKNSLLHIYMDEAQFLGHHTQKILFNKNDIIQGLNFIEQGIIQARNGRLVARGWIINGTPRSSGICWRFEPISFFKYFIKNQNIWNQFINDIKLNGQIQLKVNQILQIGSNYKKNYVQRNYQFADMRKTQLPMIINKSVLQKIKGMKHWDSQFKKNSKIKKKILYSMYKPDKRLFVPLFDESIQKITPKSHRTPINSSISSIPNVVAEERIYVNSVLNKLQSMVELPTKPILKPKLNQKIQFTNLKMIKLLGPQSICERKNQRYSFRNN